MSMDTAADEESVEPLAVGAEDVGDGAVADGENAGRRDGCGR